VEVRLLLDTNRLSDVLAGVPAACNVIEAAAEVHVPAIVLGEIRCGFRRGKHRIQNEERLRWLLSRRTFKEASVTGVTANFYADICADLRKRGMPIPTNDLWIAAIAIERELVVYSRDRHFAQVRGLLLT
jgi:predicted nucleic acid-binding protein